MTMASPGAQGAGRGRLRRILVVLLVVLACLGVAVTAVTWWLHYTTLDTDGYLGVVGPVAKDPQVQRDLSAYVAGQVVSATDLQQRATDALPSEVSFLAGPLTDQVEQWINKVALRVVQSPQAYDAWIGANRFAHEKTVGLLEGNNTHTYIEGDTVQLNTLPLVSQALQRIDEKAPRLFGDRFAPPQVTPETPVDEAVSSFEAALGRTLPDDFGQIKIVESSKLKTAQTGVRIFNTVVVILPIVTIALFAAAIYFARRRLRAVLWLALGSAAALLVARALINWSHDYIVDAVSSGPPRNVVAGIVAAAIEPIVAISLWLIIAGIVAAVAAWLAGNQTVVDSVKQGSAKLRQGTPVSAWVGARADWLRLAGIVAALVVLLFVLGTLWAVVLVLAVLVLYQLAISWMAAQWPFARQATDDRQKPSLPEKG
jgi:hypothetical protein